MCRQRKEIMEMENYPVRLNRFNPYSYQENMNYFLLDPNLSKSVLNQIKKSIIS